MGATYWWLPRLTGRELKFKWMATAQPYLWFIGMMIFSIPNHIAGLLGLPRRVFDVTFLGAPQAESWIGLTKLSAWGAMLLFVSVICYLVVTVATWLSGKRVEVKPFEFAQPLAPVTATGIWDRMGMWTIVAVVLIAVAYAYPLFHLLAMPRFGSPGFTPF
jgi:cytochrome c oxidase subunit 1